MSFTQEKRKLQKIFNNIKYNKRALDNLKNKQIILDFFKSTNIPNISIVDTEWIAKSPTSNDLKTIHKGALIPESLVVNDFSKEIELPDFLLPYIDTQLMIKTPPDSSLLSFNNFTTENYTGDHISVKGDGGNIYTGSFPLAGNNLVPESDLNIAIPSANTKKVWNVIILHTNPSSGDEFSSTGELVGIRTQENTLTCESDLGTVTITDIFECRTFEQPTYPAYHKITDFTELGFTGVGDFTDKSFATGPPDCDVSEVTTQQTLSKTFSAMDEYTLRIDGSQWNITQGMAGLSGVFSVTGSHITSITVTFQGYRPYYSSLTQKEFKTGNAGGGYTELINLPDTNDGDTLPYTSMTFQRNFGSLGDILDTDIINDTFIVPYTIPNAIQDRTTLFKIEDGTSTNFPFYYMKVNVGASILSPAIVNDPNPHVQTQDDAYSISGTTYARTTINEGLASEAFIPETQDVQYRLIITIKNPFWYQEIRKYGTSEQFE